MNTAHAPWPRLAHLQPGHTIRRQCTSTPPDWRFRTDRPSTAGVTAIIPTTSFYGPLQNNTNQKTEAPAQFFTPINFYSAYPALDGLHMGVSVNNPFGLGSEWPDNWVGRYITTKVNLQTFFFNYSLSYKITDDLSGGGRIQLCARER